MIRLKNHTFPLTHQSLPRNIQMCKHSATTLAFLNDEDEEIWLVDNVGYTVDCKGAYDVWVLYSYDYETEDLTCVDSFITTQTPPPRLKDLYAFIKHYIED